MPYINKENRIFLSEESHEYGKIDINKIHEFSNIFELNGTTNTEKYTALIKSVQKTNYEIFPIHVTSVLI